MALATELVHNASLLHDDVIDSSLLRRGKVTVNKKFGERSAVFAGVHNMVRGVRLAAEIGNKEV